MARQDLYALADTISQRAGRLYKGPRSWRRLLVNGPLASLLAKGEYGNLSGAVAILSRLGGWTQLDMAHSTLWEVYTSEATDQQAADLVVGNSGRQPASAHKVQARMAGLLAMTSASAGPASSSGMCQVGVRLGFLHDN
jgi:hypothetical protein